MKYEVVWMTLPAAVDMFDLLRPSIEPVILEWGQEHETFEQARVALVQGKRLLWIGRDAETKDVWAWALTELAEWPSKREVVVVYAGASRTELWMAALPVIEQWARQVGAERVSALVRPGLARVLTRTGGFESAWVHVSRPVARQVH